MTDLAPSGSRRPAWLTAPVLTVAALSIASGLAQFSVTAVIGDVASAFGEPGTGDDLAAQIGLPTTTLGAALALVRLASLGALPASALADRFGRRSVLLTLAALGLSLTTMAALAPSFWVYVALVALARPLLSAVNALAGVVAAEETTSRDRSAAIALVTAAYGVGAGVVSLARTALPGEPSFRVVTAFALLPLIALPFLARLVREPRIARTSQHARGWPGAIPREYRARVTLLAALTGTIGLATGPGFTYLFVYGEDVLGASAGFSSLLVLGAGPAGLIGILLGRAGADRLGRRVTAGALMALVGASVAYGYAGTQRDLAIGYLAAIAFSSGFAPPAGALAAELVPTRMRATVAGWITVTGVIGAVTGLLTFGVLADAAGSFAAASLTVGIVVAVVALGFAALPETRGHELDEDEDHDAVSPGPAN
ncbi:MFS transporter [Nitriliruptor alkaliphilus]|uniref:MFS transporter n=1 Tax=Nitriliruptor alkaliphilus TaxID=427918 RepID=UPI000695BDFD|nr:MFS transporter [Nitriliruptor alkaliphilus]